MKYEYDIGHALGETGINGSMIVKEYLNTRSREGWELVSAVKLSLEGMTTFYFKKEIKKKRSRES